MVRAVIRQVLEMREEDGLQRSAFKGQIAAYALYTQDESDGCPKGPRLPRDLVADRRCHQVPDGRPLGFPALRGRSNDQNGRKVRPNRIEGHCPNSIRTVPAPSLPDNITTQIVIGIL